MKRPSVLIQRLLPHRLLGRMVYRLARCSRSWISRPLIAWFAGRYGVDLQDAEHGRLWNYASLNEFFTRRLKPGARPIAGDERTLISPVDGFLTQFGSAEGGEMIQAKGLHYRLEALLGEPAERVASLMSGVYATLYLAPHQYHRVHLPLAGALEKTRYIPGRRYSVNARTAAVLPGLFCRNERVVCWFETAAGPMAVVLVGALNVSSISTAWLGEIASGRARVWEQTGRADHGLEREFERGPGQAIDAGSGRGRDAAFKRCSGPAYDAGARGGSTREFDGDSLLGSTHPYDGRSGREDGLDSGRHFERAAEIGHFNLGSTVVLVLPPGQVAWQTGLAPGQVVRMGQALGSLP